MTRTKDFRFGLFLVSCALGQVLQARVVHRTVLSFATIQSLYKQVHLYTATDNQHWKVSWSTAVTVVKQVSVTVVKDIRLPQLSTSIKPNEFEESSLRLPILIVNVVKIGVKFSNVFISVLMKVDSSNLGMIDPKT